MTRKRHHPSQPNRSRLFQAIALSLVIGGSIATAQATESHPASPPTTGLQCETDRDGNCQFQASFRILSPQEAAPVVPRLTSARFESVGFAPSAPGLATAESPFADSGADADAAPAYEETGVIGDPDSWITEEFQLDWGLEAVNAHHAYARGLTGAGVRLGVLDSGTGLAHSEFQGKDHISLTMADLLEDGTRCNTFRSFGGANPCFATRGDEVQLDYVRFNASVPQAIRDIITSGNYVQPGFTYQSHGTHVGGTIAANRDGSGMHGVAFGSNLAVARMFHDTAREWTRTATGYSVVDLAPGKSASTSAFADVFRQMAAAGVRAVNHSWGYTLQLYYGSQLDLYYNAPGWQEDWEMFRDGALETGMIHVWAAGNLRQAPPAGLWPIAGLTASLPRYMPELEPYWLSVVNIGRTGNPDNPYGLSGSSMMCGESMNWCLAAPGSTIASSVFAGDENVEGNLVQNPDGSYTLEITAEDPVSAYAYYSGTSMATPHVTGALGLLFERFPYLTGPQVRDILLTTATDIGAPGIDPVFGWGLMNLQKAIEGYGQFRVDTDVVMDQRAGGVKVWEGDAWDDWTNDIGGPGRLSFASNVGGWLRLSGNNSFNGLTLKSGTLELTGDNDLAADVAVEGGRLMMSGNNSFTDLAVGGGLAEFSGSNTLSGGISVTGGSLLLGGENSFGGLTVENGLVHVTGSNEVSGNVTFNGGNLLVANGGSLGSSALTFNSGLVLVNGILTGDTVIGADALLAGSGQLGSTRVFGSIAPGNSIGTLTFNGDYIQEAGSQFFVEMQPPSATDKVVVNGTATLNGGTVVALRMPGVFGLGQRYNFLSATGGVTGTFDGVDNSQLGAFLKMALSYDANNVYADVIRAAALASVAGTANQLATARAIDALPNNSALLQNMVMLSEAQAAAAFDQLSGELHPSLRGALADDSRHLRNAAFTRARTGHDAFTGQSAGAGFGVWAQATSKGGLLQGDGNAASVDSSGHLFLVGADYQLDGGLRFGAFGGSDRTDLNVGHRSSRARAKGNVLGLYAGHSFGGFGLHGGYTRGQMDVRSERNVVVPGLSSKNQADYDATTSQAFVEAGYRFGGAAWELEPYVQFARVNVETDGFSEVGGASALTVASAETAVDMTTAGLRFSTHLKGSQQAQSWLSLRGGLGYRKASGDLVSAGAMQFPGGTPFTVHGAPISDSATIGELGLAARLSERTLLELGYSGQFSSEGNNHGANARVSIKF